MVLLDVRWRLGGPPARADYDRWSAALLDSQRAFVVPSSHQGRPNTRFAILNPLTTFDDLVGILDTME